MNIGKNVKKLRIQKGLTQSELAQVVGVGASMIGHIEKGLKIPSLAVALEMAKFFGFFHHFIYKFNFISKR